MNSWNITPFEEGWKCCFNAMASPCEIILSECDKAKAMALSALAHTEVKRIEKKFSRYRDDNVVYRINNSNGHKVDIDEEISRLLSFSNQCYLASDGLFDVTSGILRKVWKFDGSDIIPSARDVEPLLPLIGWDKVTWDGHNVSLLPGMELDFGGVGKEYAVDRVLLILAEKHAHPLLINFGGDIATNGALFPDHHWRVGIEGIAHKRVADVLNLNGGAIATSGDARRFLLKDGIRYSHVLNPVTGQPVVNAPHSVTVAAPSCVQAGMLSTIALLQGNCAEKFLDEVGVTYFSQR